MPPKHRFHQAGVGSRTGMRPPSSAVNLDDFLDAGKAALNTPASGDEDDEEEEEESDHDDSEVDAYEERSKLSSRKGRPSAKASSSRIDDSNMDLAHTSGISPRSYIRSARASDANSVIDHGSPRASGSSSRVKARRSGYDEDIADLEDGPSFELSAMAGDDLDAFSEADSYHASPAKKIRAPAAGLAARKAAAAQERTNGAASSSSSNGKAARRSKKAAQPQVQEEQSFEEAPLDDVSAEARTEVIIDSDVGEEALEGTTAGAADRAQVRKGLKVTPPAAAKKARSKPASKAKAAASTSAGAAAKKPRGRPKKQATAEVLDDSISDAAPPLLIEKRTIKKSKAAIARRGPPSVQQQVVERVPSSVQRGERGSSVDTDTGLRRSARYRYGPLEYWRGERAVFGRASLQAVREDDDEIDGDEFERAPQKSYGAPPVPVLKELIRIPRAEDEGTFSGMKRTKKSTMSRGPAKRAKNAEAGANDDEYMDPTAATRHPEDGWDAETDQMGEVWDAEIGKQIERRIVCTAAQARPRIAHNNQFAFEKVFGVDEFMAAGVLEIPVGGSKPVKPTRDNNYVFVVIQGAVLACVHRTQFHLAPGGIFLVPKGNTYSIENIGRRPAKLVFSQAKNASTELFPSPADAATGTSPARGESSAGAGAGQESFGEMTFSQPGRAGKRRAVDESLEEEDT